MTQGVLRLQQSTALLDSRASHRQLVSNETISDGWTTIRALRFPANGRSENRSKTRFAGRVYYRDWVQTYETAEFWPRSLHRSCIRVWASACNQLRDGRTGSFNPGPLWLFRGRHSMRESNSIMATRVNH